MPTVGENRDGIGQAGGCAVRRCRPHRLAVAVVTQDGRVGRWRGGSDRRLPPSQRSWAAAARERPQLGRMPRCILPATGPALRCAPRRGPLGGEFAAMAYTRARSTRLMRRRALPRKAHAAILLPPGPGGPSGVWRSYAILAGEGCAGRLTSGRASLEARCARSREPPRARGARYALEASEAWRGLRTGGLLGRPGRTRRR